MFGFGIIFYVNEILFLRFLWRPRLWPQKIYEYEFIDGIFKLLRSSGIDSKESIPQAYAAWRAGTTTPFLLGS